MKKIIINSLMFGTVTSVAVGDATSESLPRQLMSIVLFIMVFANLFLEVRNMILDREIELKTENEQTTD